MGRLFVGDVSVPTCKSHERKAGFHGEERGALVPPEIVISPPVNHLPNDREKQNAPRPFSGLQGILPPIQTD